MKYSVVAALAGCLAAGGGCESAKPEPQAVNSAIVQSIGDMAIENAIIRQQTLYPYHFVPDGGELNELGLKEANVLAGHYLGHSGRLNIRRGGVPNELYASRVATVLEMLSKCGVPSGNVQVVDGMPGGDGMPSEQVLMITFGRNSPSTPLYFEGDAGAGGRSEGAAESFGAPAISGAGAMP